MRTRIWLPLALMACLPAGRALAAPSTAAAESLLSAPDDAGWSLEAMMAARPATAKAPEEAGGAAAPAADAGTRKAPADRRERDALATLHRRVATLQAQVAKDRDEAAALRDDLAQARAALAAKAAPVPPAPDAGTLKAVADRARQNDVLTNQVSTLKAALADREQRLRGLLAPQDALRRTLAQRETDLDGLKRELAGLRGDLAQKTAALAEMAARLKAAPAAAPDAAQQAALRKAQAAAAAIQATLTSREAELADLHRQRAEQAAALKTLQDAQAAKDRTVSDLNAALAARGDELKQAAAALAALREKQKQAEAAAAPVSDVQRRSYMAGVTMADGLGSRLEGWKQAGVETDMAMFRAGLADGLQGRVRLKPEAARRAQAAFMQAVQAGAVRKVADAQKQLAALAKGRRVLKSAGGISWYRVRAGRPVAPGAPVTLSMTEQVAGGAVVSRVPALTLRPGDDVPSIVRDGMYLPGEGGEVVAYGLARQVYGDLPLPPGVQPFTVMEYHLKGERPARQEAPPRG